MKDDATQLFSELSSFLDERAGISPFIPYRINEQNMRKLDAIFGNKAIQPADTSYIEKTLRMDSFDTLSSHSTWDSNTPRSSVDIDKAKTQSYVHAHAHARASDRMNDFENASVSSLGSISITEQKQNFDSLYLYDNKKGSIFLNFLLFFPTL